MQVSKVYSSVAGWCCNG